MSRVSRVTSDFGDFPFLFRPPGFWLGGGMVFVTRKKWSAWSVSLQDFTSCGSSRRFHGFWKLPGTRHWQKILCFELIEIHQVLCKEGILVNEWNIFCPDGRCFHCKILPDRREVFLSEVYNGDFREF